MTSEGLTLSISIIGLAVKDFFKPHTLTHEARHFLVTFSELKVRQNFEKIFFFKLNFWQRGYCRIVNELSAHIFAVAVSLKLKIEKKSYL